MASEQFQADNLSKAQFIKYDRIPAVASVRDLAPYLRMLDFHVFEKLDGGNCQVRNIGGWNVVPGNKANFLKGKIVHSFPWFEKFSKWVYSNSTLYNLPQDVVLFGEWSGNHTIQYDGAHEDKFFMIDVLDTKSRRYLPYGKAIEFLRNSGVEGVNFFDVLRRGKLGVRDVDEVLREPSSYYNGHREGLVLKAYDATPQRIFKVYYPDFSERVGKGDGTYEFMTPPRFRKNVFKLLEEDGKRVLTLDDICVAVMGDIKREEGISVRKEEVLRKLRKYLGSGDLMTVERYLVNGRK